MSAVLVLLLAVPVVAALLCLATRSRVLWERLNVAAFAVIADKFNPTAMRLAFVLVLLVAAVIVAFSFWMPAPVIELVNQSAQIIGGAP